MRKYISITFSTFGIFCIIYYCGKYNIEKSLCFNENVMLYFYIVMSIILIALLLSIQNYIKLEKVQKQNIELLDEISHLSKLIEKYHYSEMKSIQSNMECILDLDERGD